MPEEFRGFIVVIVCGEVILGKVGKSAEVRGGVGRGWD
jgi:hypothetical protein